jgi:hypothetical protein
VTGPSVDPETAPAPPPAEPRQRWRLTYARDSVPADQVGRVAIDAWAEAIAVCGLPVAGLEPGGVGRARLAFAAPLPAAARGEAELAELWLLERVPAWMVREALADGLPAGHRWIAAEDVWLGAPALAGRVVAADWRIEIAGAEMDRAPLAGAARALVAAGTLPRVRMKGSAEKRYDLRPLFEDVAIVGDGSASGPFEIRIRTRFDPELGSGRPEEIILALSEAAGLSAADVEIVSMARERLVLADDGPTKRRR